MTSRLHDAVLDWFREHGADDTARSAFARRARWCFPKVTPEAISAEFDTVTRHAEMAADHLADLETERLAADAAREAEHASYLATLPRGPERSVVQAAAEGEGAHRWTRDLTDGHPLTASERTALSGPEAIGAPIRRRTRA